MDEVEQADPYDFDLNVIKDAMFDNVPDEQQFTVSMGTLRRLASVSSERTLHVTVNSWGDWLLEKDDGGTPTRVAVMW